MSKLQDLQQQFQKRRMVEKEKNLIKLYNDNQQRSIDKVVKSVSYVEEQKISFSKPSNVNKRGSPGIDKSRPLAPLNYNNDADRSANRKQATNNKTSLASERQKIRDEMKRKEQELLERIKEKQVELERMKSTKNKNMANGTSRPSAMDSRIKNNDVAPSRPRQSQSHKQQSSRAAAPTPPRPAAPKDPNLKQCHICGRNFAKDRIDKHVTICEKTSQKKRKIFDMTKARTAGTEAEKYVRRGMHKKPDPPKKNNWRKQHEQFMQAVNQAKQFSQHIAAGGKASDLPPPPPADTSDYVTCPHCKRKFSEKAADRHIPKCKDIISNKGKVMKAPPTNSKARVLRGSNVRQR